MNLEKEETQTGITEDPKEQYKIKPTVPEYEHSKIEDHKEDEKKEKLIEKLSTESNRPQEKTTFVRLVKYPCEHICIPAAREWWKNLKCSECGGRWTTEEDEVSLDTVTTIVHHVRMKK